MHAFFGSAAAGLMIVGAILMIASVGFQEVTHGEILHQFLGFILLVSMPLILTSGAFCKLQQQSYSAPPKRVYLVNWGHTIMGSHPPI